MNSPNPSSPITSRRVGPSVPAISLAELVAKSSDPIGAIKTLGSALARSQIMGPTDRLEIGEAAVLIMITEGWTAGEFFRTHQLSFGKFEKRIDAAMAEFKGRGGTVEWLADGSDGAKAVAKFSIGDESVTVQCTKEEAIKAGWTKNAKWNTEPQTMLRARVKKRGILALAPDIFYGEYDEPHGELVAIEPDANRTAAASAVEAAASVRTTKPAEPVKPNSVPPEKAAIKEQGEGSAAAAASAPPTPPAETTAAPAATTPPPSATPASALPALPDAIQAQLVEVVGDVALFADWALSVGWLQPGQGVDQLAQKHAATIIKKPDVMKQRLADFAAKKGGAK